MGEKKFFWLSITQYERGLRVGLQSFPVGFGWVGHLFSIAQSVGDCAMGEWFWGKRGLASWVHISLLQPLVLNC